MNDSRNSTASRVAYYQHRITEIEGELRLAERAGKRFSKLRGLAFFAALFFGIWGFTSDEVNLLAYVLAAVAFGIFLWLIVKHERNLEKVSVEKTKHKINELQLLRFDRDWKKIPDRSIEVEPEFKTISNDLGLFGHASLFSLISRTRTPFGTDTLKDWILKPAIPTEIVARQDTIRQLRQHPDFLEQLDLEGRRLAASQSGPAEFVAWSESDPWLQKKAGLVWFVRLLTVAILLSIVIAIFDIVPVGTSMILFFSLIAASIVVNVIFTGTVHDIFNRVNSRNNDVLHYGNLFSMIEKLPVECEWLNRLKSDMRTTVDEPQVLLKRLARIMRIAQLRLSPVFGFFHALIQIFTFWDFHILVFLESWQRKHGTKVRPWFTAIGKMEAIASLATIAHDHPDWCYPKIAGDEEPREIVAASMGHPYLSEQACVPNDVQVGPCGSLLLVTGSNMSGKSTLLRAIGTNVTLAQMGAPVCAAGMLLPPLRIATSMRVQDSLEDGVSFFMAELKQLKGIVDLANEFASHDTTLLFLLDEILQGTNSVERHIAVARVVHQLVASDAIGAVSTHDLELANHEDLKDLCKNVHFRETIDDQDDGRMTFDYRMHDGLATTTNALKLLRLVGLEANSIKK